MELRPYNEGSDLIDPLSDYSASSLFSQSLNLVSSSSTITHLSNPNSSTSDSFYAKLKATVLSSPNKLLEQAKTILAGRSDHVLADNTTESEKVPRGKRPGLGRKVPKFVMKPMPSQPAVSLEPSMDLSKLTDPDEYFDAFERMENAKKEVKRLKGEPVLNLDLSCTSLAPRPRRPSLLGLSATYTHRTYPSVSMAGVDENLLPSQETLVDTDILSPARHDVVPDSNVMNNSSSMRVSDSKATTPRKVSELDELLSLNHEGLDEDGVQNLLLDKLQIKSVDIGKLPDWRIPLPKFLTTSTALPKTNDTLYHLRGASKAVSRKDTKSPAKSRSPLASISMLNRQIAKRNPSNDLFPSLRFDSSPEKATSHTRESGERVGRAGQSDENDARENMCNVRGSPVHGEEDTAVNGEDSIVSAAKDADQISEPKDKEVVVGQFDQIGNQTELHENRRSLVNREENIAGSDVGPTSQPENKNNEVSQPDVDQISELKDKEAVVGQFDQIGNQTELHENRRPLINGEENIVGSDVGPTSQPENKNNEVAAAQEFAGQHFIFEAQDMENFSLNEVEKDGMDKPSNVENIEELTKGTMRSSKRKSVEKGKSKTPSVSEEPTKKGRQAKTSQPDVPVSKETKSKRRKVEGAGRGGSKGDRRFSLYYAGTTWDVGVRRSTRIRMRPMEFWSNERFLYGRVHESLPTLIGVKYASPSKEAEPGIKVKSFVSDEYKDLVYDASLH